MTGMKTEPNPIHADETLQHVDVRIYFDRDEYAHGDCVDKVADALQSDPGMCAMVSAYELIDGKPDSAPLA